MRKILLAFFLWPVSMDAWAQAPAIQWAKSFGGTSVEAAQSVCQTTDGGYIVAGNTQSNNDDITGSHGGQDIWVTKIAADGTLQWEKALGGSQYEVAGSVIQTTDGGYAIGGATGSTDGNVTSNHGAGDFWLVKLNSSGSILWQKCFGGTSGEACNSMVQTSDGGYIMAGYSYSDDGDVSGHKGLVGTIGGEADVWVLKVDDTGRIEWENSFGGSSQDVANAVRQTKDGGYIVACTTASDDGDVTGAPLNGLYGLATPYNYWILKLSATGALQWHKVYGGDNNSECSTIAQTMDGGYLINGNSFSDNVTGHHGLGSNCDEWIVKIDSTGGYQWDRSLGEVDDDFGTGILQLHDSTYVVSGYVQTIDGPSGDVTSTCGGGLDYWLTKLTTTGTIVWEKTYGGSNNDAAYALAPTADGGYILAGGSQSNDVDVSGNHGSEDFWIVKLGCGEDTPAVSRSGNMLSTTVTGVSYQWELNGVAIAGATNATYVATANGSYTLIVTNGSGCSATSQATLVSVGLISLHNAGGISVFPNPTTGNIFIEGISDPIINIYNPLGELLKQEKNANISIASFPDGIYLMEIFNEVGGLIGQQKVIKNGVSR